MRTFRLVRLFVVVGVFGLALSGCGGEGLGTLYPVSGKATLDGEPLKDAQISFMADTAKGNKAPASPFGKCKEGSYTLTTKESAGAPAGWYKVVVTTKYPGGPENPVTIPKDYTDPAKTDLSVEVKPGAPAGAYDLKLTSK
jgi:hypothetical protein